ncbi:hypothetical protein X749_03095 [Mesorhizobium sp. LNJC391B00]|nr:hypothetical protein X749_03095 [Mesorhizobium sp. LNJC391B00]
MTFCGARASYRELVDLDADQYNETKSGFGPTCREECEVTVAVIAPGLEATGAPKKTAEPTIRI